MVKRKYPILQSNYTPVVVRHYIALTFGELVDMTPRDENNVLNINSFLVEWPERVYVYPPYSKAEFWVEKLYTEIWNGRTKLCVALLPMYFEEEWFKQYVQPCADLISLYHHPVLNLDLGWDDKAGSMLAVWNYTDDFQTKHRKPSETFANPFKIEKDLRW